MQLRAFLAALAPVATRQPQVFVDACRAAVDIQGRRYKLYSGSCVWWVVTGESCWLWSCWFPALCNGPAASSACPARIHNPPVPLHVPAESSSMAGRRPMVVLKKKPEASSAAGAALAAPAAPAAGGSGEGGSPGQEGRDVTPAPAAAAAAPAAAAAAPAAGAATAAATPAPAAAGTAARQGTAARPAAAAAGGSPPAGQDAVTPAPPKTGAGWVRWNHL